MDTYRNDQIHTSSIINEGAEFGRGVTVGPYSIIEGNVKIGDNTRVDSHVLIAGGAEIGNDCKIAKGAVLSTTPQDLKFEGEESRLIVGDRTVIREYCTLNRGTEHGGGVTEVGADCLLMAYVHIAHDCKIGNHVILANAINMAGHIEIHDFAAVGGICAIHQFVRIGKYAFVGGHTRIPKDVPPFVLTAGNEFKYYGLNSVGLRRRGFSNERISGIKKAYKFIYRSKLNIKQALKAIHEDMEITEDIQAILEFFESSERGIMGG